MIQILYTPGKGNTERMAEEITRIMPGGEWEKEIITLDTEIKPAALYLIGFGIRRNTLPFPVLQLLDQLENKRVAFFASGALGGVEAYKAKIESQILSCRTAVIIRGCICAQADYPRMAWIFSGNS